MKVYVLTVFCKESLSTSVIGIFSSKVKAKKFQSKYSSEYFKNAKIDFDVLYPLGVIYNIIQHKIDKVFYGKLFNQYMEV